jgi:hypothetical protein
VDHLEGNSGERAVAILRFQSGSLHVSIKDCVIFAPMASLDLY